MDRGQRQERGEPHHVQRRVREQPALQRLHRQRRSRRGFEAQGGWGRLLGKVLEENSWRGTASSSPDGLLLLSGRGIQPGAFPAPAELTDVLPTLLYSLGLPIARDLDGRVLTTAFSSGFLARQPLTFVPSYETLAEIEIDEPPELAPTAPPE